MIWVYPAMGIAAGVVLLAVALLRSGQRIAFALSVIFLILGASWWNGVRTAHCPADTGGSIADAGDREIGCISGQDYCCVELLPMNASTCRVTEASGFGATIRQVGDNWYLYVFNGETAVASCVDWRPWKAW